MLNSNDLLVVIKKIALDAVNASKPCEVVFGKVTNINPLTINIEQKVNLTKAQLILTRNVTNYNVNMTIDHTTEVACGNIDLTHNHAFSGTTNNGGSDSHNHNFSGTTDDGGGTNISHTHKFQGTKQFTVQNALVVGDEVVLLRMQGGQKYIVIDRVIT